MRDLHESSTPTITFRRARAAEACAKSYRRMARHVGGITRYGADTPLPIATVLDVLGLDDALWALDAAGYHRVLRLWACDCAERAVPIFERERPDDRRPREAIRVSRLHAHGLATEAALAAARDAAWAAERSARDAAWATARAAAWVAAEAAAWDTAQFAAVAAGDAAGYAAEAAALDAARDAARDAAWGTTWVAARAARAAAEAWQTERLRAYLEGQE